MKLTTYIYRRAKRDGRNPSTGAKSIPSDVEKKAAEEKQKTKFESQTGD